MKSSIEFTGKLMSRARGLLAYGGLDGVMNRPLLHEGGTYPQFAVTADGYRLTDSTGDTYIDWINGWGTNCLGHSHPDVNEAMIEQISKGTNFGLMHPIEVEVAQQICDMVPGIEKVAFGKNGSDSLNAAIRIARAATGRNLILQCGFHGFHNWYVCLLEGVQGILPSLREHVIPFQYNDRDQLNQLFQERSGQIAAVVMEPVNMFMPEDGYLEFVANLTREHGAVLIFDEVVTAFRLAKGGAQSYFNVQADLICMGKAMANGMPLSAVGGRNELMQHLPSTSYGMTYRGETVSLAAARACLKIIDESNVPAHLESIGESIRQRFNELTEKHGIKCELAGPGSRMTFMFFDHGSVGWAQLRSMFVLECLKRGVLTNGNLLASWAHDDDAVEESLSAFDEALAVLRRTIDAAENSDPNDLSSTRPNHDASAVDVAGYVDVLSSERGVIRLGGWLLVDSAPAAEIVICCDGQEPTVANRVDRPDIAEGFPDIDNAINSGFIIEIPEKVLHAIKSEDGSIQLSFVAKTDDIERFRCLICLAKINARLQEPRTLSDGIIFL